MDYMDTLTRMILCVGIEVGCLHSKQAGGIRENGLTITRAEIGTRGGRAVGSFYVTDALFQEVNTDTVEMVRREIGGTVSLANKSPGRPTQTSTRITSKNKNSDDLKDRPRFSLGTLLWSQLEQFSDNFRPIKS
ncbi:hypothetical protein TEA_012702 [Camellia sinensis var. sinensis]|uniref:Uncharacterized protein n=1 Tax=Camellia sinensis var. sinensis TaxID=542762 RepID=A0A4S4EQW2_CAMSN|nr:hypothetical protein TEA_012702 [Camellia sinensis var. sinensis]